VTTFYSPFFLRNGEVRICVIARYDITELCFSLSVGCDFRDRRVELRDASSLRRS
jgi:hypothetical protein